MLKGFSSNKTEEVYNKIITNDFTGEQFCELANRLKEYGEQLIYERLKKKRDKMFLEHKNSIYDTIRSIN